MDETGTQKKIELLKHKKQLLEEMQRQNASSSLNNVSSNNSSNGQSASNQKSLKGKINYVPNTEWMDTSQNYRDAAFVNKLLIALLTGMGIGAIATAVYIFMHLDKIVVNL